MQLTGREPEVGAVLPRRSARWCQTTPLKLKAHLIRTLQPQHRPYFAGGCHLQRQLFEYAADLRDLLAAVAGKLALAKVEAVLQSDTDIAALDSGCRDEGHLVAAGRQYGPDIVVAKQVVGGFSHEGQVP